MQTICRLACYLPAQTKKYHQRIYGFDCWIEVSKNHRYAENNAMSLKNMWIKKTPAERFGNPLRKCEIYLYLAH